MGHSLFKRLPLLGLISAITVLPTGACGGIEISNDSHTESDTTVILEAKRILSRTERSDVERIGIELGEYMGENKYLALVPAGQDLEALKSRLEFLTDISPLDIDAKIDAALKARDIPDYAQRGERIIVQVSFFRSRESDAMTLLAPYSDSIEYDMESNMWLIDILPNQLDELAKHGGIRRIEVAADPKLLEEEL